MAVMMNIMRTSETSVNFHDITRLIIPESSRILSRRCEDLKSRLSAVAIRVSLSSQHDK